MPRQLLLLLALLVIPGCLDSLSKQVEKKSPDSIIGKKTDKIAKFDPNAAQEVSSSEVQITNPVTGPLEAYGPMLEQISKSHIEHALRLYEAEHGAYPANYDEFMTHIIKANRIQLPVLPGGWQYAYDEQEVKLKIVRATPAEEGAPVAGDAAEQAPTE